ncbi:hypothetical protein HF888_13300 [Bermanella marisrubri]|uniref:Uncharacterized protein n=1 Tax=Bermanella marisrubri TaxID=207949 RepID=Q1N346_9GAMM|nr:hypothetical protein [Bermanella marisrubri]EAT12745.1 hypothetical protein RED65_13712 [Oceanobacter sp. RED65] [Bermanella marisrubri]QIZ85138.1 hypothetical protein HF888_13300 [Bermanella marisrubri]
MDIMGLSKRMFDHLGQMSPKRAEATNTTSAIDQSAKPTQVLTGSISQQLQQIAQRFDVRSLEVSDVIPLQQALKDSGLINDTQVRAQGMLTQMAYHHYESGPMNLESSLQEHVGRMRERPTVLADHRESQHLMNIIKNLQSARAEIDAA